MDKEEFLKINVINDFISYISKKNYSVNTYTSYINDLYYFYCMHFSIFNLLFFILNMILPSWSVL